MTAFMLLLPVPWLHVVSENPPGSAWRLDGRLTVNDAVVDPPGRWSWLAVGRPQLVIEVLRDAMLGTDNPPRDLREGRLADRPALSDPAAAAVGLRHAGRDVPMRIAVRVRDPLVEGLPFTASIAAVNGVALTDRSSWESATSRTNRAVTYDEHEALRFTTGVGEEYVVSGPGLPYRVITTLDLAPSGLDARIRFAWLDLLPTEWFRRLSLGSSHGMMIALTTYTAVSGEDLAQGRHIAGTGGILGDGTVTRIGGLPSKAKAAMRDGADVLVVPASQADELDDVDLSGVTIVPVTSLDDAIEWLSTPVV